MDEAPKTQQFYLLWVVLCLNIAAGIGIIGIAKTMMTDIFGSSLPTIANAGFAATYVLMISVFNMLGRFGWAYASDYIGRKKTYYTFFVLGALPSICPYPLLPCRSAPIRWCCGSSSSTLSP